VLAGDKSQGGFKVLRELEDQIAGKQSSLNKGALADRYEVWCSQNLACPYPVTYSVIGAFLCYLVTARNGSTKSIGNVVTAIRQRALLNGYSWITELQTKQLKDLVSQMRFNDSMPIQRKRPIQIKHLIKGTAGWDFGDPRVLQEALILFVGHDSLFRIGELIGGLTVSDITWASDYIVCSTCGSGDPKLIAVAMESLLQWQTIAVGVG